MARKTIYQWAVEYCGDPASHVTRGDLISEFLVEEGLRPEHKLLDVGCGALSQGVPLINYLDTGNYVGLDPNGWLIEAALQEKPRLLGKEPSWSHDTEFRASGGPFDYVVAHSVLSHVAHWQLEQALLNIRGLVAEGAIWLASLRLDQYDLYARQWRYPDVSYFRLETVQTVGWHAGWLVKQRPQLKERLQATCPNDFHDWLRLEAIPIQEAMNNMRLDDEERRREDQQILELAEEQYRRINSFRLRQLGGEIT